MLQVVDCAWPTCEGGAQPEISPFRCCPFCPSEGKLITDMLYRYSYLLFIFTEGITDDDDGGTGVITMATLTMVTLCCFLTFLLLYC